MMLIAHRGQIEVCPVLDSFFLLKASARLSALGVVKLDLSARVPRCFFKMERNTMRSKHPPMLVNITTNINTTGGTSLVRIVEIP